MVYLKWFCMGLFYCFTMNGLAIEVDPRSAAGPDSPNWLKAVGKLDVPSQIQRNGDTENYIEHCTATLISDAKYSDSNIIITAWHCLENYQDVSKDINFTIRSADNKTIMRTARRLSNGGDIDHDWAILKLSHPVGSKLAAAMAINKRFNSETQVPYALITMAGYSSDDGLGQGGKALTYHAGCQTGKLIGAQLSSNCLVFKGASGGPVVLSVYGKEQFSHYLIGIISQGNGADTSTYVPGRVFSDKALRAIKRYRE